MRKSLLNFAIAFLCFTNTSIGQEANVAMQKVLRYTNVEKLLGKADDLRKIENTKKQEAIAMAQQKGWPIYKLSESHGIMELMYLDDFGYPVYYATDNLDAANSISTSSLWPGQSLNLSITGSGITMGEWDGGATRTTHQEFGTRVTQMDGATSLSDHATHVAGTMVAAGVNSSARGMAYQASLHTYDWNNDNSEMATAAANGLLISNHSYGTIAGWYYDSDADTNYWYGVPSISATEDYKFGQYNFWTREWDDIAQNAPYYLIVKSAGNDRNDNHSGGHLVRLTPQAGWTWSTSTRDPDGNYDCISTTGNAKNILTVGAVNDLANGYTNPAGVVMSSFSSWGPTDDGRIKPDIVANGVTLFSTGKDNDTDYYTSSGTSMSGPSVAGSLGLLQEYYEQLNNSYMRSATLKGLVIHTADEAGPSVGPDYMFGWGLMNTKTAAEVIRDNGTNHHILERVKTAVTTDTITITSNGIEPIVATICWTDVPGTDQGNTLNPTASRLVNDLDLRIYGGATTYSPYVLNPANPSAAATTGDNIRDNVEKVVIANPTAGTYQIVITHKGTITGSTQDYGLIISGGTIGANSPSACAYTLELWDSYGDGWNNGTIDVTINGNTVNYGSNFINGSSFIISLPVNNGDNITLQMANGGDYPNETAYQLRDNNNNVVVTIGAAWGLGPQSNGGTPNAVTAGIQGPYSTICPSNVIASLPWTEDFSNGFSDWSLEGLSTSQGNLVPNANAVWEYRGPNTTPDTSVGSRGAYSNPAVTIQSATKGNGFAVFDSDFLDNAGIQNNFGNGLAASPHSASLISPTFDFTSFNNVNLSFHSYHRHFGNIPSARIAFSTDGGNTWPDTIAVHPNVISNASTLTNEYITIDISNYLGGLDSAKFQFLFFGDYYFWMIDDILLEEVSAVDLALSGWEARQTNENGNYFAIPVFQNLTTSFGGQLENLGVNTQPNPQFQVNVTRNGTPFYSQTLTGTPMNYQDQQVLVIDNPPLVPSGTGNYVVEYKALGLPNDADTSNNTRFQNFFITDSTFALDRGAPGLTNALGTNSWAGTFPLSQNSFRAANYFQLTDSALLTSGSVRLANNSTPGGTIKISLRPWSNLDSVITETAPFTVTQNDLNGWITRTFPQAITIPAGEYIMAVELNSNNGASHMRILDDLSVPQNANLTRIYLEGSPGPWYNNGNAYLIRMNVQNPNQRQITFQVDMSQETVSPSGVFIAGMFQGWNPNGTPMTLDPNTGFYTYTGTFIAGDTVEFKFLNGSIWENPPMGCSVGQFNNRYFVVPNSNTTLPVVCFNQCSACPVSVNDTIAYFDFNGNLQGWTATNIAGPANWVFSTTGSTGQYSVPTPINSTTSSNGFLKLDSDGAQTPTPGSGFTNVNAYIESPIIDLSNEPGVVIEFQHFMRVFGAGELVMAVSDNGGATWQEFDVRKGLASNAASADPVVEKILVSQFIGGAAQAKIRFHWRNTSHYLWMIDDIVLRKQPATDFKLAEVFYNGNLDTASFSYYYSQMPLHQAQGAQLNTGGIVENISLNSLTNLLITSTLTHIPSNQIQTQQSVGNNIPGTTVAQNTSISVPNPLTFNAGLGVYSISIEASSDSIDIDPSDNFITADIEVTDTVYARDLNNIQFIRQILPGRTLASLYEFNAPASLTSVSLFVGNPGGNPGSSSIGAVIKAIILDENLNAIDSSANITIGATGWQNIQFNTAVNVLPGKYCAAFRVVSDSVWIAIDANRVPAPRSVFENVGGLWYFANFNAIPYLRLNASPYTPPVAQILPIGVVNTKNAQGVADSLTSNVMIAGTVTTTNFRFTGYDLFVEDATGGIKMFEFAAVSGYTPTIGDSIFIRGNIDQFRGQVQIRPDSIALIAPNRPLPQPIQVGDLTATNANLIVNIPAATVVNPSAWTGSGSFNVELETQTGDTVVMRVVNTTNVATTYPTAPTGLISVTGVINQFTPNTTPPFSGSYQILPRFDADIIPSATGNDLTFAVDMSQVGQIAPSGVYVFYQSSTIAGNVALMTATGGGIYQYTLSNVMAGDTVFYTFINGAPPQGQAENVPMACQQGTMQSRGTIMPAQNTVLPTVCFGECGPCQTTSCPTITTNISTSAVSCFGGNDGAVLLTPNGGVTPYSYNWSSGHSGNNPTNLSAGSYFVTILDNNNCGDTINFTITQPPALGLNVNYIQNPTNASTNNGEISVNAIGGVSPYSYNWSTSPAQTTNIATSLAAGTYYLTITDFNNCTYVDSFSLSPGLTSLNLSMASVQHVSCFGGSNGSATVQANAGTPPFSYQWSTVPAQNSPTAVGLASGFYTVTVTDGSNFSDSIEVFIGQAANDLTVNLSGNHPGLEIQPSTSNNYLVDIGIMGNAWGTNLNSSFASGLVEVARDNSAQDSLACGSIINSAAIAGKVAIVYRGGCEFGQKALNCQNAGAIGVIIVNNVAGNLNTIGGLVGISVNIPVVIISASEGTNLRNNMNAGPVNVEMGNLSANEAMVSCFNGNDGGTFPIVNGGTSPYSYLWSNGNNTRDLGSATAGTYTLTVRDARNCATGGSITITQPTLVTNSQMISICFGDSVFVAGNYQTSSGTFIDSLLTTQGCDSIVTTQLSVIPVDTTVLVASACNSFTWSLNAQTYTTSGVRYVTLNSSLGCDSVVALDLSITGGNASTQVVNACGSYTWPVNNQTYMQSGLYFVPNFGGCDTIYLDLTINQNSQASVNESACDSYLWPINGQNYTQSGVYTAIIPNHVGCDSLITLNLSITPSKRVVQTITACDSYFWPIKNRTYSSSQSDSIMLTTSFGCDSLAVLDLTINSSSSSSISQTACDSYFWPLSGMNYLSSGQYSVTLTNALGCDSVISLNLTINNSNITNISATSCTNYNWPLTGITYLQSGTYSSVQTNQFGCDSTVILNLNITGTNKVVDIITACDSYTWPINNQTYASSGVYYEFNTGGCDTLELNLTINNSVSVDVFESACVSYTWPLNNETYTQSGIYTQTLVGANNCDSVVRLNLTINEEFNNRITPRICFGQTYRLPNGNNVSLGGTYTFPLTSRQGCDSIVEIILTVDPVYNINDSVTINQGDSILIGGIWRSTAGSYTSNLSSIYGCDSIVNTVLSIVVGINKIGDNLSVKLYPNPNKGQFILDFTGYHKDEIRLEVLDMNGKIVNRDRVSGCEEHCNHNMDLQALPSGVYFITITTNETRNVIRFSIY